MWRNRASRRVRPSLDVIPAPSLPKAAEPPPGAQAARVAAVLPRRTVRPRWKTSAARRGIPRLNRRG